MYGARFPLWISLSSLLINSQLSYITLETCPHVHDLHQKNVQQKNKVDLCCQCHFEPYLESILLSCHPRPRHLSRLRIKDLLYHLRVKLLLQLLQIWKIVLLLLLLHLFQLQWKIREVGLWLI